MSFKTFYIDYSSVLQYLPEVIEPKKSKKSNKNDFVRKSKYDKKNTKEDSRSLIKHGLKMKRSKKIKNNKSVENNEEEIEQDDEVIEAEKPRMTLKDNLMKERDKNLKIQNKKKNQRKEKRGIRWKMLS